MIPSPIRKVLSTFQSCEVRALLMGGQACVFYGAAEFSRDTDFAILADAENLARLQRALDALQAEIIAVPPFAVEYLERGHAVHFRCHHPEASGLRVDVMAKMRGVDAFEVLWTRRTTLTDGDGVTYELMSLPDLVKAKKTQRDKDWPMIRRLIEADYAANSHEPNTERIAFWLSETRTPELLAELAHRFPDDVASATRVRPALRLIGSTAGIENALLAEEQAERAADRIWWEPLKRELETLRRAPK